MHPYYLMREDGIYLRDWEPPNLFESGYDSMPGLSEELYNTLFFLVLFTEQIFTFCIVFRFDVLSS